LKTGAQATTQPELPDGKQGVQTCTPLPTALRANGL
jgi:hypothetical protein